MKRTENKNLKALRSKKKKKKTGRLTMGLVIVVLIVVLSYQMVSLYNRRNAYLDTEAEKQEELLKAKKESEELLVYEEYTKTPEFIESTAKKKLGMLKENEIVFREKQD
ncbi:MAG: septum formation initiator family protein [Lachnospiraceae bacterium]|nr:septum formation initiator family protein [Lachnospiraceae bacterium]